MANKKEEITQARLATDTMVRELKQTVDALPRTDHMTLPAVSIVAIDEETRARMIAIADINNATDPNTKIDGEGRTLQQVRNQFEFGVTELDEKAGKHEIVMNEEKNGNATLTVIPPVVTVIVDGKEKEEKQSEVVFQPTPPNIAPVDADAPKNPVEEKIAEGKKIDEPSTPNVMEEALGIAPAEVKPNNKSEESDKK